MTKAPRSQRYLPLQGGGRPAKRVGWGSRHKLRIGGEAGGPPTPPPPPPQAPNRRRGGTPTRRLRRHPPPCRGRDSAPPCRTKKFRAARNARALQYTSC